MGGVTRRTLAAILFCAISSPEFVRRLASSRKRSACGEACGWSGPYRKDGEGAHHCVSRWHRARARGAAGQIPAGFFMGLLLKRPNLCVEVERANDREGMTVGDIKNCYEDTGFSINCYKCRWRMPCWKINPRCQWPWDGEACTVWKRMPEDENYYGLGDKAGRMNRRKPFVHHVEYRRVWLARIERSAVQRTIPIFYRMRNGAAYGLFFDNTLSQQLRFWQGISRFNFRLEPWAAS